MIISVFLRITLRRLRLRYLVLVVLSLVGQACHYNPDQRLNIAPKVPNPITTSFNIDQHYIELVNGFAEQSAAPNSDSKITTRIWGSPKTADLNADGQQDAVLILSQNSGGSGTFYYLVVAIREGNQYIGSNGFLLGDRIQPQTIQVVKNRITVQFLDRLSNESFVTPPSIPKEQLVIYDPDTKQLIEVEPNFTGEADPSVMTLGMKTWYWEKTAYNNDSVQKPKSAKLFSLKFEKNGKLLITTDCNSMQGEYRVTNKQIKFNKMISTRMLCESSQEPVFTTMLDSVSSYFFTSKGRLVLALKYDSGSMIFW